MAVTDIKDKLGEGASDLRKLSDKNIKQAQRNAPDDIIEKCKIAAKQGLYEAKFTVPSAVFSRVVKALNNKKFTFVYYRSPRNTNIYEFIAYWGPTTKKNQAYERNNLSKDEWVTLIFNQLKLQYGRLQQLTSVNGRYNP